MIDPNSDNVDPELARLIEAAHLEESLHPEEDNRDRAIRVLEDAAPVAAMSIVQLSRQAQNENLRFRASTYILDRVLGDVKGSNGTKPPWEELFEGVTIPNDASALE